MTKKHQVWAASSSCYVLPISSRAFRPTMQGRLFCSKPARRLILSHRDHFQRFNATSCDTSSSATSELHPVLCNDSPSAPISTQSSTKRHSLLYALRTLWQFSRPHTVYGTFVSVLSITVLAWQLGGYTTFTKSLSSFFIALLPALSLNVFIVGLNQYYDIEIDRINKPYLPLASGALSVAHAASIIIISLIFGLSFCFCATATPALRLALIGSVILGTLYSAPPTRLKRFALIASMCILTVRGMLINICFFLHAMDSNSAFTITALPPILKFTTGFFVLFGIIIALLKDVPDIKGDRIFGIKTFSVRMGANAIFRASATLLCTMFLLATTFLCRFSKSMIGALITAPIHVAVAGILALKAKDVDTRSPTNVHDFYMLAWKTFYIEYLLLPLAGL